MLPRSYPPLKLEEIPLPSDSVTFPQIRREQPDIFNGGHIDWGGLNIYATIAAEADIAKHAYAKALGLSPPSGHFNRRDTVSLLNDDYKRYGLSTGIEKTKQLIRDIESAATEQARRHQKGGR